MGKTYLAVICGRQNSAKHIMTLKGNLLPFAGENHEDEWILQQDGASIHRSYQTKQWLEENDVKILQWPAKSPDLNPIENLWGVMVRRVYHGCRQFRTVTDLDEVVMETWFDLGQEYLDKLIESLPRRVREVIRKHGGPTKY